MAQMIVDWQLDTGDQKCCRHFSKFQCNLLHRQNDSCKENKYSQTAPISDHPECEDLVVTYGRWLLTRIEPQWSFHLLFGRECTASNSKTWYGGSILSLRVLGIFWVTQCINPANRSENARPDTVFKGQYLPSLSINYVAINKDLEKLPSQL